MMSIPLEVAEEILVRCGRHCCICRRFRPMHLQVHHIVERAEGGTDEPDNLIALCVSCHSDVHAATKLTRRFTVRELKRHRDAVYELVAAGKLPSGESVMDSMEQVSAMILDRLRHPATQAAAWPTLGPVAVQVLLASAAENSAIVVRDKGNGFTEIGVGHQRFLIDKSKKNNPPEVIKRLLENGLVAGTRGIYALTDAGARFADDMVSSHDRFTLMKAKCLACGLHFMICTWFPERHSTATLWCPECGQHEQSFFVWQQMQAGFIFEHVPGPAQLVGLPGAAEQADTEGA